MQDLNRMQRLIERARLPLHPPRELSPERFLELMAVDKKVLDGNLRLVLLKAIGSSLVTASFEQDKLMETLSSYGR